MKRVAFGLVVLLLGFAVAACSSQARDWTSATERDSVEAYQAYLREHPDGEFVAEARRRLEPLEWQQTQESGTVESYRQFMTRYPDAKAALAAKANIAMAGHFAVQLVSSGSRTGTSCGGPGAAVVVDIFARSGNVQAVVSPLTIQARASDGRWTGLRQFAAPDGTNGGFEDVVLTACMDSRDNWLFGAGYALPATPFDVYDAGSATATQSRAPRDEFTITFSGGRPLRLVLVFGDEVSRVMARTPSPLVAVRGFGQTIRF